MARRCEACAEEGRRRLMPDDQRHLHELRPGARFRFPGDGRTSRLLSLESGRVVIEAPGGEPEEVSFEARDGERVEFTRPASSSGQACAGGAQVEPLG